MNYKRIYDALVSRVKEEARLKMSKVHKGVKHSPEHVRKRTESRNKTLQANKTATGGVTCFKLSNQS